MAPVFKLLYEHGAEIVLSGHDHDYERFAPTDPAGNVELAETAARFRDRGLTGWDLAGPEARFPDPLDHARAFEAARAGILPRPNIMGLVAMEAAYRFGDEWLEQVVNYLEANLKFLADYCVALAA